MARPKKDPAEQLTFRVNSRMTEIEGEKLEADAAAAGLTVSDYLRGLAVQAQPRQPKATPERAALILSLGPLGFIRSDISHARADINQMLKDRWAYKYIEPERVETVLAKMEAAIVAIEAIADKVHNNLDNEH
jgi:hypothetical protein